MSQAARDPLDKVRRVSTGIMTITQIANAFWGIGLALAFIALAFSNSFQLNVGDGDLAVTFFSDDTAQAVINLYDARSRFGIHMEAGTPAAPEVTRLVSEPTMQLRVAGAVMLFLNTAVIMYLLEHVARLFGHYSKGEIFTSEVVAGIRRIGFALVGFPVVALLNSTFAAILASRLGADTAVLHFDMPIGTVAAAVIVVLISWIMDAGRALREENELVI